MCDQIPDTRYDRRSILAIGASAGAAALLLPESAGALLESSSDSTWVVASVEGNFAAGVLNTRLLPSGRELRISVSESSSPPNGQLLAALGIGQTIAAEGASQLSDTDTSLVAHRVVPAVIGSFSDVDR